jgi:hypothetical protein
MQEPVLLHEEVGAGLHHDRHASIHHPYRPHQSPHTGAKNL